MAGDSAKFVVEFQADVAKLRKEIQSLKKDVGDLNKGDQRTKKEQKRYTADEQRRLRTERREKKKDQDLELKHVRLVHRSKISMDREASRARTRIMEQEVRAFQRMAKRGPLPAHLDPDGRYNNQRQPSRTRTALGYAGAAVGGAALFGAGMVINAARAGYERYMELQVARGRSIGLGATNALGSRGKRPNADIVAGLRGAGGGKLGYSAIDVANMNPLMARATGHNGPRELMQATRASGMEAGEVGDIFGGLRRSGFSFTPGQGGASAGANMFKKLMSAAVQSGLEHARSGELVEGIVKLADQQHESLAANVDPTKMAAMLAAMGRANPALQGNSGVGLYTKLAQGIMKPGGGEWGEAFMNQAMGFGKPGGKTSYYDAEYMREEAASNPEIIKKVLQEARAQFGNGHERNFAMREATGMTLHQAQAISDIDLSSKSSAEKQAEIAKIMEDAQPLEKQSLDAMKEIGGGVKRIAELTDKAVGVGAKFAPIIEHLEDLQYKVLKDILTAMDTLIGYVKDIRNFIFGEKGGDKAKAILAGVNKDVAELGGKTAAEAQAILSKRTGKLAGAVNAAAADPSMRETYEAVKQAGVWNFIKGDMSGTDAARSRAEGGGGALDEMNRQAGMSAAMERITGKYGAKARLTERMLNYVQGAGDKAVVRGGVDEEFGNLLDQGFSLMEAGAQQAPAGMKRKKRGATDKGVVPTPPAAPASQTGEGTGGDSASSDRKPHASLRINIGGMDPRIGFSPAPQGPGTPPIKATRGIG